MQTVVFCPFYRPRKRERRTPLAADIEITAARKRRSINRNLAVSVCARYREFSDRRDGNVGRETMILVYACAFSSRTPFASLPPTLRAQRAAKREKDNGGDRYGLHAKPARLPSVSQCLAHASIERAVRSPSSAAYVVA